MTLETPNKKIYTDDPKLQAFLEDKSSQILQGKTPEGGRKMERTDLTLLTAASSEQNLKRYRPGEMLVTYVGADENGHLLAETRNGKTGSTIKPDSVILRNPDPIKYPNDYNIHELRGKTINGYYNDDGTFTIDEERGNTILHNEWASTSSRIEEAYEDGQVPKNNEWIQRKKRGYSWVFDAQEFTGSGLFSSSGNKNYILEDSKVRIDVNTENGKLSISSIQPIDKTQLENTYTDIN